MAIYDIVFGLLLVIAVCFLPSFRSFIFLIMWPIRLPLILILYSAVLICYLGLRILDPKAVDGVFTHIARGFNSEPFILRLMNALQVLMTSARVGVQIIKTKSVYGFLGCFKDDFNYLSDGSWRQIYENTQEQTDFTMKMMNNEADKLHKVADRLEMAIQRNERVEESYNQKFKVRFNSREAITGYIIGGSSVLITLGFILFLYLRNAGIV